MSRTVLCLILSLASISAIGCGDPALHPVSGKVTLGGKSYNRLIVYMRPIEGEVTPFNLGVGETDASGKLSLRSSAGGGLAEGKYRVSFTCVQEVGNPDSAVGTSDEKNDDDRSLVTEELVPEPYSSDDNSPVEFDVTASEANEFIYDIPGE
jgi:hypothetical protein